MGKLYDRKMREIQEGNRVRFELPRTVRPSRGEAIVEEVYHDFPAITIRLDKPASVSITKYFVDTRDKVYIPANYDYGAHCWRILKLEVHADVYYEEEWVEVISKEGDDETP